MSQNSFFVIISVFFLYFDDEMKVPAGLFLNEASWSLTNNLPHTSHPLNWLRALWDIHTPSISPFLFLVNPMLMLANIVKGFPIE